MLVRVHCAEFRHPCSGAATQFSVAQVATRESRMGVRALHKLPASGEGDLTLRRFYD